MPNLWTADPRLVTLAIALTGFGAFVAERWPPEVTALLITLALILTGQVTPEQGFAGFANPVPLTVLAMLLFSEGLVSSGALTPLRDWLVTHGGDRPGRQILLLGLVIGPLSACLSNTALTTLFIPVVRSWSRRSGTPVAKLLIPVSYFTILGGMTTLIGTAANLLGSQLAVQLGYRPFGLFEFAPAGVIFWLIGLVYLSLLGHRLLPEGEGAQATEDGAELPGWHPWKAPLAIAILAAVILVVTLDWLPLLVAAWLGVATLILSGVLATDQLYSRLRWDVILLLALLLPLGDAMQASGATDWLAARMLSWTVGLPEWEVLLVFFTITALITEFLSNIGAVLLLLPVAVTVASQLGQNPQNAMLAVIFAASNSFLTPIGYQTNTLVYRAGGYRFGDFLRVGLPLALLLAIATPLLLATLY